MVDSGLGELLHFPTQGKFSDSWVSQVSGFWVQVRNISKTLTILDGIIKEDFEHVHPRDKTNAFHCDA